MSPSLRAAGAQVVVEVKTRLRSPGTLVALFSLLALGILWMPDPHSRMASITWKGPAGQPQSSLFTTAYVGTAAALLAGIFLALGGFYFVAGSIRRDRERGIGAIVAATPVKDAAYLAGHWAAHTAYLALLSLMMLATGLVRFLQFGQGSLDVGALVLPLLLVALPAACVIAALTVLFDVTPGLRGRAGLVIFFFVIVLLMSLPAAWSHDARSRGRESRLPLVDPLGLSALNHLIQGSVPADVRGVVSSGLIIHDAPVERVPWAGLTLTGAFLASRLSTVLWALPPLGLALLLFDRFDPGRFRSRLRGRHDDPPAATTAEATPVRSLSSLTAVHPQPGLLRSVVAEVLLVWHGAKLLRWLLVPAALAAAALPGEAAHLAAWVYLLLLVPVLSEVGAREEIAGTRALIASQPGVPASRVLWKAGAVALFVALPALPLVLRTLVASPAHGLRLGAGLVFVAAFSTAAGSLTGGGRLFSGLYLVVWYAALNRSPGFDFCGFSSDGSTTPLAWLSASLALLALAAWVEHTRRASGGARG